MELAVLSERWRGARPVARVVLLSLALGVGSWLEALTHPDMSDPWVDSPAWVVAAVALAFGLAEAFVFYVQYRREAIAYTMTELPMAMALLYLGLPWAIAARLVGSLLVILVAERPSWYKMLFNAGLLSFETVMAFVVFHLVAGHASGQGERVVVALLAALVMLTFIDMAIVSFVISFFEGSFVSRMIDQVRSLTTMVAASSAAATLVATFSLRWPRATLVGLIPIAAVWVLLRRGGQTSQRLRDFEALHRLSTSVSQSLHRSEIAAVAISEVQDLLRSDRAALVLFDQGSGAASVAAAAGEPFQSLPDRLDDPRWQPFVEGAGATAVETSVLSSLGIGLGTTLGNVILAPVREGARTIGMLVIGHRGGPKPVFDNADVIRATAIANRLSAALLNAELHEQIEEQAWRDRLTGLPNRNSFERAVAEAQAACSIGETLGVVVFGIDRFREVNETLGHQVGDAILIEMSRRLASEIDEGVTLARVTGDEFGVLVAPCDLDDLTATARRLVTAMKRPFVVGDVEIIVEVGAGVATCALCGLEASDLLRQADVAMNWAKEHHTAVETYRGEIDLNTPGRLALLSDLRSALERRQLDVWFQPKIDLVSNVVVGAEALVRWEHPTLGFVPPIQFVSLAETTGLVTELTNVVLAKSTAALRLLNDVGFRLDVSVNLSTLDLLHEDLVHRVQRHLDDHQVPAEQLTLEITETALLEDGLRALSTAEDLRALGVHLSIDDFGTGFSSLSYLRKLPASEIKVDRSFVLNLMRDERDEVIVRSTIDLGHNLGLKVTAEGVEDKATMERLWELGCDLAQGYHIAKPMPLTHFVAWLTTSGHQVARAGLQGAWKPSTRPLDA